MDFAAAPIPPSLEADPRAWLCLHCGSAPWRLSTWAAEGDFADRPEKPRPSYFPIYNLHYVSRGALHFWVDGNRMTLRRNDMLLLPRRTSRYVTQASRNRPFVSYVHFEPGADRPDPLRVIQLPLVISPRKPDLARETMSQVVKHLRAWRAGDSDARLLAQAEFMRLLHLVIADGFDSGRLRLTRQQASPPGMAEALAMLEREYGDPALTLQRVAEAVGVSQGHFTRLFRQHMGRPPKVYLMNLRLDRARTLLLSQPDLPVAEVSERCGYADPFYFSLQFRKKFGQSPSVFRRAARASGAKE